MQYKDYRDGIKLSKLGMGVMQLLVRDGKDALIDYEKAKRLIDLCMERESTIKIRHISTMAERQRNFWGMR